MLRTQDKKKNPAENKLEIPAGYRPLSSKRLRLEVQEIPGYRLHWFSNRDPRRIPDALKAGWQFVEQGEVDVPDFYLAGDAKASAGTDLGTRISVEGGGYSKNGQPARLILMKCAEELALLDDQYRAEESERIAQALKGGAVGQERENSYEQAKRYNKINTSLFDRKT